MSNEEYLEARRLREPEWPTDEWMEQYAVYASAGYGGRFLGSAVRSACQSAFRNWETAQVAAQEAVDDRNCRCDFDRYETWTFCAVHAPAAQVGSLSEQEKQHP